VPDPAPPDATSIHGACALAVHGQDPVLITLAVYGPPEADADCASGVTPKEQEDDDAGDIGDELSPQAVMVSNETPRPRINTHRSLLAFCASDAARACVEGSRGYRW
jgi:hypothetical protein